MPLETSMFISFELNSFETVLESPTFNLYLSNVYFASLIVNSLISSLYAKNDIYLYSVFFGLPEGA